MVANSFVKTGHLHFNGLHKKEEAISCPYCDIDGVDHHEGPCAECEKSFQVLSDLIRLSKDAQKKAGLNVAQTEQYMELEQDIVECRTNLMQPSPGQTVTHLL